MSENTILPAEQVLPSKLMIIPLNGKPVFPGLLSPMMLTSSEDIAVVDEALSTHKMIGLLLINEDAETDDDHGDEPTADDLYKIGTAAKIVKKINLPDGGINVFISTQKRFRVKKVINSVNPIDVAVEYLEDENENTVEVKALTRQLISEMKAISENNPLFSEEMRLNMVNIDHPGKIADFICSILNIERTEQQAILETLDIQSRMERVLLHIKKEHEVLRIQKKIQKQINQKIEKSQRDYFLREELKAIKQELGMTTDAKSSEYQRFKEIIETLPLEGEAKEQVQQELDKFSLMDPNASEFIVTRNYLDTIVNLPWHAPEHAEIDMVKAHKILERDHYGLEDVKDRILEFIAVRKLKKDTKGSIICLVGPPGVGKTSIGKSIASALNKEFFRFSVGGMRDEAEIKGHRRTYVGAMPGKLIQGLKIVKTRNPVFMIDEIDKLGASYQGDPSSALLEVLDPEQNVAFRDHYLDLPFDLSDILFIATANSLDTIPRPLLDRMEVIRLSGYIEEEKIAIAKKYLIPKSMEKHGIKKGSVKYNKSTLSEIYKGWAREAGMRSYEKYLDKIHRKVAKELITAEAKEEEKELPIQITKENISDYLGKPYFSDENEQKPDKAGMTTGLAWTNFGGDTLIIEAISNPGKGMFALTGKMGEVMQESARLAYTHVKSIAAQYGIKADYFAKRDIHLHIPAGATPKDGPSAGITMATTLLSLASGKKVKRAVAMTGELSLTGAVLPIGGLKEKTIAAKRSKIKEIIIPKANEKDLEEIPENVKKGITFYPVSQLSEVLEIALPTLKKK